MNFQFKATNTDLEARLTDLVEQKFSSLKKFVSDDDAARCEVEFEKETAHQSGKHFRVEANFILKGKLYRADATEESFEEAIDEVRDELDKELRRANDKQTALERKGGRAIKEMLHSED